MGCVNIVFDGHSGPSPNPGFIEIHGCAAKRWKSSLAVVLCIGMACALGGCESPEEIRQAQEQQCAGYGFQPGTVPFAECLQRESLAARYRLNQAAGPWWGPAYGPYPRW
jgi:hypothetical protein